MTAVLRRNLVLLAVLVAGVAGVLALATPALAHPLGNFTVNRYARLEVSAGALRVLYVLDLAEIPAFQERRELEAGPEAYARDRAEEIAAGLELVVDGRLRVLSVSDQTLEQPSGQGGLRTLRLTARFEAPLAQGTPEQLHQASFADTNDPERIGWREIVVTARSDAEIVASDAPAEGITDELRTYPDDRLQSPLDRRKASFSFTPGSVPAEPPPLDGSSGALAQTDGFAALITRSDLTPLAVATLLALALGFGAVHAVGPGHGKTIMAAYLVSSRGRPRDAVLLGGVVSIMHTASVLVLGLVLVQVDRSIAAEAVYPILTLVSGVAVTAVGVWLLVARWRKLRSSATTGASGHDHGHGHDDDHDHGHGHGHGHSHAVPAGVAPLSRRGLVALGASGGLFPSPSAVVVIVAAVGLGRAGLGLALLAAFSVGLAVTLSAVGLALVYGRSVLERRGAARRLSFLPVVGAVALVALGVAVIVRGVLQIP
jgi:nickel/cobalt exporter